MLVGAAVNGFGIRNPKRLAEKEPEPEGPAPEAPAREAMPAKVDTIPEEVPCLPVAQPTPRISDPRMGPGHRPG
jgi:hypothetical protein